MGKHETVNLEPQAVTVCCSQCTKELKVKKATVFDDFSTIRVEVEPHICNIKEL